MMTVTVLGEIDDTHLLSERDVSLRSGLPGPLVEALLRPVSPDDVTDYHCEARVYPEESVCRAQLAVMMLNADVRMRFIHAAMREPRTLEELRMAVAQTAAMGGYMNDPSGQPRKSIRARVRRLLAGIGVRRGAGNATPTTAKKLTVRGDIKH